MTAQATPRGWDGSMLPITFEGMALTWLIVFVAAAGGIGCILGFVCIKSAGGVHGCVAACAAISVAVSVALMGMGSSTLVTTVFASSPTFDDELCGEWDIDPDKAGVQHLPHNCLAIVASYFFKDRMESDAINS